MRMNSNYINRDDRGKPTRVLIVISNLTLHEKYAPIWALHEITTFRVDSMHEAIKRLIHGDVFLFIVINADATYNLFQLLKFMRDATDLPIFIFTNKYSVTKKLEAIDLFLYGKIVFAIGFLKEFGQFSIKVINF